MTAPTPPSYNRVMDIDSTKKSFNMLVYGNSKSGKSFFAGTAGDRVLYVDTADAFETLRSPLFRRIVNANPIYISIQEQFANSGIVESATALAGVSQAIEYALDNFPDDFDTIVVDNLSNLRKFALYKGLEINQTLMKSHTLNNIVKKFKVILPAIQDYGTEMQILEQWVETAIRITQQAEKNLLIVSHERQYMEAPKNDKGERMVAEPKIIARVRPAVTGTSFPDTITSQFDSVLHAELSAAGSQSIYKIRTQGTEVILANTRHGGLWETHIPGISKEDMKKWPHGPNFMTMLNDIKRSRESVAKTPSGDKPNG